VINHTSLDLDLELVASAGDVLGTKGTTETVHRTLEDVVRREKLRRLADWKIELTPEEEERLDWGLPLDYRVVVIPDCSSAVAVDAGNVRIRVS
jgi:Arc/MetJ family transcription regulator